MSCLRYRGDDIDRPKAAKMLLVLHLRYLTSIRHCMFIDVIMLSRIDKQLAHKTLCFALLIKLECAFFEVVTRSRGHPITTERLSINSYLHYPGISVKFDNRKHKVTYMTTIVHDLY